MSKLHNVLDQTSECTESALSALDEQITAHEHEFFRSHSKLIRMLCALPPDQLLGLSLGVLSGATQRRPALSVCQPAHELTREQSIESASLQAWLFRALSSSADHEYLIRGLAAFRIGEERGQDPVGDSRNGGSEAVAEGLLTTVVNTIEDAVECAWCIRKQEDIQGPPEVETLRASLLDNEDIDGFVELTAGYASIRRIECVGQLTKRQPPYALITVHRLFDLQEGGITELCNDNDNPTVVMLREDLVHGLQTVAPGERVRLRLESGLAGHVLGLDGPCEHPRPHTDEAQKKAHGNRE